MLSEEKRDPAYEALRRAAGLLVEARQATERGALATQLCRKARQLLDQTRSRSAWRRDGPPGVNP